MVETIVPTNVPMGIGRKNHATYVAINLKCHTDVLKN